MFLVVAVNPNDEAREKVGKLAACLRPVISLSRVNDIGPVDGQMIQFAARRHRVGSLLYKAVGLQPEICPSTDCQKRLKDLSAANVLRLLRQKAAAKKLTDLLSANDVPTMILKGTGLARQLYAEEALRESRDIDILVSDGVSDKALSILADHGYRTAARQRSPDDIRNRLMLKVAKDVSLKDPDDGQLIELHQRLIYFEPGKLSAAFTNAVGNVAEPSISNSHYIFYLMLHGALTFWQRLKWVMDLSLMVRWIEGDQQEEILELARVYHCEAAIVASLVFVEEIFPSSLNDAWKTRLANAPNKDSIAELVTIFRNSLYGNAPGNIMNPGRRTRFNNPAWYIFRGNLSYASMMPRRLMLMLLTKL